MYYSGVCIYCMLQLNAYCLSVLLRGKACSFVAVWLVWSSVNASYSAIICMAIGDTVSLTGLTIDQRAFLQVQMAFA